MQQVLNSSLPASMVPLLAVKLLSVHMPHHFLKLCFLMWIAVTPLTCCAVCPSFPNPASVAHLSPAHVVVASAYTASRVSAQRKVHDCRELFEAWCEDPRNGIIIADFAVAGTLAREVLDEPKEIMSHSGHKVDACCVM